VTVLVIFIPEVSQMALLESVKVPLGSPLPDFSLTDPDGNIHSSRDLHGKNGILLSITCNHCPYAVAVWPRFITLAKLAEKLGIKTAAINPNINPAYPDDSPEMMKAKIREWGIPFPYLVDETQETARTFDAQCTPEFFLYDAGRTLVYHGRLDDNWQDGSAVKKRDLQEAIEALAAGRPVPKEQRPSMGCSIKWRS